jgi:hypothetical protein
MKVTHGETPLMITEDCGDRRWIGIGKLDYGVELGSISGSDSWNRRRTMQLSAAAGMSIRPRIRDDLGNKRDGEAVSLGAPRRKRAKRYRTAPELLGNEHGYDLACPSVISKVNVYHQH